MKRLFNSLESVTTVPKIIIIGQLIFELCSNK